MLIDLTVLVRVQRRYVKKSRDGDAATSRSLTLKCTSRRSNCKEKEKGRDLFRRLRRSARSQQVRDDEVGIYPTSKILLGSSSIPIASAITRNRDVIKGESPTVLATLNFSGYSRGAVRVRTVFCYSCFEPSNRFPVRDSDLIRREM